MALKLRFPSISTLASGLGRKRPLQFLDLRFILIRRSI
jgi:hypothetical protein